MRYLLVLLLFLRFTNTNRFSTESSILRTFLQVSGAVSIGALAYRWLQNNEAWIQERTGVSLGLGNFVLNSTLAFYLAVVSRLPWFVAAVLKQPCWSKVLLK